MKRIIFMISALVTLAACVKEQPFENPGQEITGGPVFTARTEPALSKTALSGNDQNGYQVQWRAGDRVRIDCGIDTAWFVATGNGTATSFTFAEGNDLSGRTNATFEAFYPNHNYLDLVQQYVPGNVDKTPMYSRMDNLPQLEGAVFQFENILGIIRINLSTTLPGKKVRKIQIDEDIYPDRGITWFEVRESDGHHYAYPDYGAIDGITLDCGEEGVEIGSTPVPFYINAFAHTYQPLIITVSFTDGTYQTRTSRNPIIVERSRITDISLSFNNMASTSISARVKGGGTQEAVQLWANGPKWAKFNVGSSLTSYAGVTDYAAAGAFYTSHGRTPSNNKDQYTTDDTAALLWGPHWKSPTSTDYYNLVNLCDWEYCDGETVQYETGCKLKGWKVTGRDTGESIFLPMCGSGGYDQGVYGYYWAGTDTFSGTPTTGDGLKLSSSSHVTFYSIPNYERSANKLYSLRAVCAEDIPADFTLLGEDETANSYIVRSKGTYAIPTMTAGNGSADLSGVSKNIVKVESAELLWATFGTATAPGDNELIRNVRLLNRHIFFETGETFQEGNALIGVRNSSNNILWSWHIWFESDDLASMAQTYPGNSAVVMDRNLGATSAEYNSADYFDAGMFYQWGRKDPFPGVVSRSSAGTDFVSKKGTLTTLGNESLDIANSIKKPNSFASGGVEGASWAETKTIFDPCPPGWKVPAPSVFSGISGNVVWTDLVGGSYDLGGGNSIYIPAGGIGARDFGSGFGHIGTGGYLYTNTTAYSKSFDITSSIHGTMQDKSSDWACNVRCVRE